MNSIKLDNFTISDNSPSLFNDYSNYSVFSILSIMNKVWYIFLTDIFYLLSELTRLGFIVIGLYNIKMFIRYERVIS